MAVRSAISVGFPGANYVAELGPRESALPGEYIVEGGQAVVVVTTGQIDNLTLSATGAVTVVAAASPTIGNLTLSGVDNIAVTATLTKTIDPVTLAATGQVIVSAAVDTAIGDITSDATGVVIRTGGDVAVPWWWSQYVVRHQAERAARRREELAVTGDGVGAVPLFFGKGRLFHVQPVEAAAAGAVPRFISAAELDHAQYRAVQYFLHILGGPGAEDDDEVLDIVEALIEAA